MFPLRALTVVCEITKRFGEAKIESRCNLSASAPRLVTRGFKGRIEMASAPGVSTVQLEAKPDPVIERALMGFTTRDNTFMGFLTRGGTGGLLRADYDQISGRRLNMSSDLWKP